MSEKLDISQLAVHRQDSQLTISPQRRWLSRYALPLGMLLSFGVLLGWATRDRLLPSKPVSVVPVVVAKAELTSTGAPLFHAAGWIEPRPAALVVSSLAPGVIEELLVVEGQTVQKGDALARLLETDAQLQLKHAQAVLQLRDAEIESARAELESAELAFQNPIQLEADLAEAKSASAKLEAELQGMPSAIVAARKLLELAEQNVLAKRNAGNSIAEKLVREAEAEFASASATLEQLTARNPILRRQHQALQEKVAALQEKLRLRLDEHRRLASARAALKAAQARLIQSQLAIKTAELQLSRMTITSPITGRVLSIQATAGMRVVGLDPHSEKGASAVVTLYDPNKLQVRVDVRLEDIPKIRAAQLARIETASVTSGLEGEVIAITSLADIQKNTLQVKVGLKDPPDLICPEMLAQVTFLAPEQDESLENKNDSLRFLVPRNLVRGGEAGAYVWVADLSTNTAERRSISLGAGGTNELIEVTAGLAPTDKLISGGRETLVEGNRIRITLEDSTIGMNSSTGK